MKRTALDHPKLIDLASRLQVPRYVYVGLLETLWNFTSRFAPQGNIGKYTNEAICRFLEWKDDPTILINALVECRLLEHHSVHRLLVHDWEEHADQVVKRHLAKHKLAFIQSEASHVTYHQTSSPLPVPEPMPVPEPSQSRTSASEWEPPVWTWKLDETYAPFVALYRGSGKAVIDEDFAAAWYDWKILDFEQKQHRINALADNLQGNKYSDPNYIPAPKKFILQEYKRPIRAPVKNGTVHERNSVAREQAFADRMRMQQEELGCDQPKTDSLKLT